MRDEALTPVQVEQRLRYLHNELTRAQVVLRNARDAEVNAKHAFESKQRRALLSKDCPKVTRGGYTTAERDAWVALQVEEEQQVFDLAEVARRAAEDYLRMTRDQGVLVASLARSVNQAYAMAGVGER